MQFKIMLQLPQHKGVRIGFTDEASKPLALAWAESAGINLELIKFVPTQLKDDTYA